ncbi:aspartate aminotransferase [Serinibacter arcticus]|uniref:Aminotransferase n=1 Tax=Serinibacter arcticus TaxID=1655435 RepID=A0A2U1ZTC8_9MICO|nr:pyridoxal phosphate-dependent aminotransferase [Serinibacter arcticus]PWD50236.1 aspartate aminotransferase [Serinibacter arcticus]
MPELAPHIAAVPPSGTRAVFNVALELAERGVPIHSLVVGEPDLAPEPHVVEAARAAWAAGEVRYAPNAGLTQLRDAVAVRLAAQRGHAVERDQVWVTLGGTQALYLAMTLLLDPGDEILVPDPGYTTFTMAPLAQSAVPVPYPLRPEHAFVPQVADLAAAVTPRTRAIVVNSPSNPLGTVLGHEVLQRVVDLAVERDLWIISDEVYSELAFGAPHVPIASLPGAEGRVLSVHSVSKTYALTGARVGYLVTPSGWSEPINALQEAMISCVAPPDQRAALAAITGPQDGVATARAHYAANLALACALLDEAGIGYLEPQGTFYLWIDVRSRSGGDVAAWAQRLLRERAVAVAPGTAFGASGEGWVRICVAASRATIEAGIAALAGWPQD